MSESGMSLERLGSLEKQQKSLLDLLTFLRKTPSHKVATSYRIGEMSVILSLTQNEKKLQITYGTEVTLGKEIPFDTGLIESPMSDDATRPDTTPVSAIHFNANESGVRVIGLIKDQPIVEGDASAKALSLLTNLYIGAQ